MASQITATLPTLDFPKEADYPTQEDWAAFSAAAELNFGILGGSWSEQMQLWKDQANDMSTELNTNSTIAQGLANYQGDWVSQGYTLGQTVSVSGIYYICKLTHSTGQNPTDGGSLYWNLALGNWDLKVNTDMSGYTSKTTPVDADLIPLSDSVSSFGIKKLSWANLKATLKTYFDTLYVPMAFSVYQTAVSTSLTTNTNTKILLTSEEFDTDNQFDTTTSKFQPTIAGYYQINATVRFGAASFSGEASLQIFKNGTSYKVEIKTPVSTAQKHYSSLSEIVYLNGTTDYLELYCIANGTSLVTTGGGTTTTRFSGFLVRRT